MGKRVVVVGAGPIGIAAALGALERGHEVTVLEAGEVGESLRRWGATRFFTPLAMNLPERARRLLPDLDGGALLTGPETAERVLSPLAKTLGDRLRTHTRVLSISRARMGRGELAGHPVRFERPFKILNTCSKNENLLEADRVLDASGVYGQPIVLGVPGERAAEAAGSVIRDLGALHAKAELSRVLLVGHGHSAANALDVLESSGARVTWAVRAANLRPVQEVANDPLPERQRVAARANELAQRPPAWLTVERRAHLERISLEGGELTVELSGGRVARVDLLVALLGNRPDHSIVSELALEIAPATEGSARLHRAVSNLTDCLSLPRVGADDLQSGEPGFFFVGQKSYGRARTFLLSTGFAQLEAILDLL